MADVRKGIELAREHLERLVIDDQTYWTAGEAVTRPKPSAHLLPNYDEFFIAYRNRSAIGERLRSVKAVTGGNALISNVVAVDGQLVGGWRRAVGRDSTRLTFQLVARLTPAERKRVMAEVRRYGVFAGRLVDVEGLP
jgi:hypothetical protein